MYNCFSYVNVVHPRPKEATAGGKYATLVNENEEMTPYPEEIVNKTPQ